MVAAAEEVVAECKNTALCTVKEEFFDPFLGERVESGKNWNFKIKSYERKKTHLSNHINRKAINGF